MPDSSDEDEQKKAESTSRKWVESQPGPSRCDPSRQGYCGYCRVLYSNLDQHLSSLKHLDRVQTSSRGSGSTTPTGSSRTKLTLLERFLQDVLLHHPNHYKDSRPSHADLPSVSSPPLPRQQLDDFHVSDDDMSLGTCYHLWSSDHTSCQPTNQDDYKHSQSEGHIQERTFAPFKEQEEGGVAPVVHTHPSPTQTPPLNTETPPPVHRKAHRKTNKKPSSPCNNTDPDPQLGPCLQANPGPRTPPQVLTWLTWEKERREVAFPSDPLKETIEEVIQTCCYGVTSSTCQQEESESFHVSVPLSMETPSDDWDSPVQVVLKQTPVHVSQMEDADLTHLMDAQVKLDNQVYSHQLSATLQRELGTVGGAMQDKGFWTFPVEEVPPTHAPVPGPLRGKSWAQFKQEDEERVERLVHQFRQDTFICYFDSESLARYGRRSQKKRCGQNEGVQPDTCILPLLDCNENDSRSIRRRTRKRRALRLASRCQVVKLSHSTQTVQLVVPAVHQPALEATPFSTVAANQHVVERTPDVDTWRFLPPSYSNIITPVQPRTSLVYLLCSPSGPTHASNLGSASKRCRKKRRPVALQGLKVKYKQVPVRFYDPRSHRILKNPPKGQLLGQGATHCPPPPCVRQLFRSLSPQLNADRALGEEVSGSSKVKGQRSVSTAFSHSSRFLLSTDSRDPATQETVRRRGATSQTPPPSLHRRPERESGRRTSRTHPQQAKKRNKALATPLQARREGLRRSGPPRTRPPSLRRGRAQRGRGCERAGR